MTNDMNSINSQLADLSARLCGEIAERLAHWTRDADPKERQRILNMIEENLPTVVANTIAKSAMLHSASGVAYLEQNLNAWADSMAKKFINPDS